jgi:hypothetical protein
MTWMRLNYKDSTNTTINLLLLLASNIVWVQHGYGASRVWSLKGTDG